MDHADIRAARKVSHEARSEVLWVMDDTVRVVLLLELGEAFGVRRIVPLVRLCGAVSAVDVVH